MADKSSIEWTDATWNPTVGCSRVSEGCRHCYAERMAWRHVLMCRALKRPCKYEGTVELVSGEPRWTGLVRLDQDSLTIPIRWKRARRIFVDSMSDLFHDGFTDEEIASVFNVMYCAKQHTFQVLTKRPDRMADFIIRSAFLSNDPFHNVILCFSAEDQATFDKRWESAAPLASAGWQVGCSAEPLLGFIDAYKALAFGGFCGNCGDGQGFPGERCSCDEGSVYFENPHLSWMIVGGESGPGARAMHPSWARQLRDQCVQHCVPFLFKQWGAWLPSGQLTGDFHHNSGEWLNKLERTMLEGQVVYRAGKKKAGRLLDGRTWDEFPVAQS